MPSGPPPACHQEAEGCSHADHETTSGMEAVLRTTEGAQAPDNHGDSIPALTASPTLQ